jgi:hypothetical protein
MQDQNHGQQDCWKAFEVRVYNKMGEFISLKGNLMEDQFLQVK